MLFAKIFKWDGVTLGLASALCFGQMVGSALAQEAPEGPSSVQETYRDWVVNCVVPAATEASSAPSRICEMRQELRQAEGNQLVLAVALQPLDDSNGASITVITPLGLLLSQPITINLADNPLADMAYQTCLPQGCIAAGELAAEAIGQMAEGTEAVVGMTGAGGQMLSVTVSLAGFSAAWNRLSTLRAE